MRCYLRDACVALRQIYNLNDSLLNILSELQYIDQLRPGPGAVKMKKILCRDWLPARSRWSHIDRLGLPVTSAPRGNGMEKKPHDKSFFEQACSLGLFLFLFVCLFVCFLFFLFFACGPQHLAHRHAKKEPLLYSHFDIKLGQQNPYAQLSIPEPRLLVSDHRC